MTNFDNILEKATRSISQKFFQLPIDGSKYPVYRERVYCYELYHQLRSIWPNNSPFTLSGEVDKSGHPLMRGKGLDKIKPDLLVHIPGNMRGNYAIIEIKPINAQKAGIQKDLKTLTAFCRHANYERGILLIYGDKPFNKVISKILGLDKAETKGLIDLSIIEIWWHKQPSVSASKVNLIFE